MISKDLKKLAAEYGLTVSQGVAYGSLGGFAATLSEESDGKRIVFSTRFPDQAGRVALMDAVNARDVKKEFKVLELTVGQKMIVVRSDPSMGAAKRMRAFLEWFLPLLRASGASGAEICPECGMAVDQGCWALVNGVAHHFHGGCADRVQRGLELEDEQKASEDHGNYFTGLLGALLGSALGAVVWAIVLGIGYVASVVGLLIGFLAEKGYDLCRGKQDKGKVVILIFAVIFGVVLGNLGYEFYDAFSLIQSGELAGLAVGDIPLFIFALFMEEGEYRAYMLKNVLMGLVFAALGVFALLRQAGNKVAGNKFVKL